MISQRLRFAVKTSPFRQYELARAIGVHHSTLSGWLCGISDVHDDDPRVIKLGSILLVPASQCFEPRASPQGLDDDAAPANSA
jgi:transcriptional regulator with XRE-family HTH domain